MQHLQSNTFLQGGKYRIIKVLGQGSFGITYFAEHTSLGSYVAIKEFFMKDLNTRCADGTVSGIVDGNLSYSYARKFQKEAHNLANLQHRNIVRVSDSFKENSTFYYVMDYIEGQNLNDYIQQHRFTTEGATNIILAVARALMYMHEDKHMLHLDLKPGNIMRRNDGRIFLIDFGLSKHYNDSGIPETSTSIGLGTPGYAPIEQGELTKSGEFRPTIDVYALGATFYKLLTGNTPPGASVLISDPNIVGNALKSASVPQNVARVVVNAMNPNPKERIQTVRDFAAALRGEETKIEDTIFLHKNNTVHSNNITGGTNAGNKKNKKSKTGNGTGRYVMILLCLLVVVSVGLGGWFYNSRLKTEITDMSDGSKKICVKGIEFIMRPVEAGTFIMGDNVRGNKSSPYLSSQPEHEVKLTKDFYVAETEVTCELWYSLMREDSCPDSLMQVPAQCTWQRVQEFLIRLRSETGLNFRLPTEAEWEFAAIGGNNRNAVYNIDMCAWHSGNSHEKNIKRVKELEKEQEKTELGSIFWMIDEDNILFLNYLHDVKQKHPNALMLYDMLGNAAEWCSDFASSYPAQKLVDPKQTQGNFRIVRGGSCKSKPEECTPTFRTCEDMYRDGSDDKFGIRLVLDK